MQHFIERIRGHADHAASVGVHCTTEETTKQALILLLHILGFSPFAHPGQKPNTAQISQAQRLESALTRCATIPAVQGGEG